MRRGEKRWDAEWWTQMRMQQDGGNQGLAWPSRRYERQENALIAGLANEEWFPAVCDESRMG
jgi:hypothetical protein